MAEQNPIRAVALLILALASAPLAAQVTVTGPTIDTATGGDWRQGGYGQCFALVPQASPRTLFPEVPVGPGFYSDTGLPNVIPNEYVNDPVIADPGDLLANVCVSGAGVPSGDPVAFFDFRLFRNLGPGTPDPIPHAYAWAFEEYDPTVPYPLINPANDRRTLPYDRDNIDNRYMVLPGSSQYNQCYDDAGLDPFRAGTFDNGRFTDDPLTSEVVISEGGDAQVAYYFLTAARSCRELDYELIVNGNVEQSGTIGDFAAGSYVVFDIENLPANSTVRLDVRDDAGDPSCAANLLYGAADDTPALREIGNTGTTDEQVFGRNSHISGIFISGTNTPQCAVPPEVASLGDRVWEDLNADGEQNCIDDGDGNLGTPGDGNGIIGDAGDVGAECSTGIPNVVVQLLENPDGDTACDSSDEFVIDSQLTNGDGFYLFTDLDPDGDYCVRFDQTTANDNMNCAALPGPAEFTFQDIGDDSTDSDADRMTGQTENISLVAGETDRSWDAGLYCPAKIGDMLILDLDRDGIQDPTEPGIEGQLVELVECENDVPGNTVIDTRITDGDGMYMFNPLPPGDYAVRFTKPGDTVFSPQDEGNDDTVDCDTDPNGWTQCVTLGPREYNDTVDACVNPPPAGLGDFVFEDKNADGIQDPGEPGIPGVPVRLLDPEGGDCASATTVLESTTTNGSGFYEFTDLLPGEYCVEFETPDSPDFPAICDPAGIGIGGGPQFSPSNIGPDDLVDSDADASTGRTGIRTLVAGQFDPSNDAGVFCPAKVGDMLVLDSNGNGIQDPGEVGFPGTPEAVLVECVNGVPGNDLNIPLTTDGSDGMYMFNPLPPGEYAVRFTAPPGFDFSPRDQGNDDAADCDTDVNGLTQCVTLGSNEYNPTVDACVVAPPPDCDLEVQKTCAIIPVVTTAVTCDDVKPIDEISMIWNDGSRTISQIDVYSDKFDPSNPSDNLIQTFAGTIIQGDEFTASGYVAAGAPNDVDWVITFDDGSQGISRFHRSCSDDGMDGPEDCGTPQGDSKDDGATEFEGLPVANVWAFEGLGGNGQRLDCTTGPAAPGTETACEFSAPGGDLCEGNLEVLTFRYLGGACVIDTAQDPGKVECVVDGVAGDSVTVEILDGDKLRGSESNVEIGDTIVASGDFGGETTIRISSVTGTVVQEVDFHTSCSQPLVLGDQYGAVELIGVNTDEVSGTLGVDVQYDYVVTNLSGDVCTNGTLVDDQIGVLLSGQTFGTATAQATQFVLPGVGGTLTNTATASCMLSDGSICEASASTTVTRVDPPEPQVECSDLKDITALSMIWNGPSGIDVLTDNGEFFANVQNGNRITFDVAGGPNDFPITISGARNGTSEFHLSCSDDDMDGPDDCGKAQGDNKGNDGSLINEWILDSMFGENGQFVCNGANTGDVAPSDDPGGPMGMVTGATYLDLGDGKKAKWALTNSGNADLFVESVTVSWPTEQGLLKKIKLEGDFVKDAFVAGPTQTFSGGDFESDANKRKLKAGDTKNLEIEFTEDYDLHNDTDFTIEVVFEGGETVSFSASPAVSAAATLDLGDKGKAKWELSNASDADLYVTSVMVTWPAQHGKLDKIKLSGDFYKTDTNCCSATLGVSDFEDNMGDRKLGAGSSKDLELVFKDDYEGHSQGDFTITVTFNNGETVSFP